jgi:hypothetical protein
MKAISFFAVLCFSMSALADSTVPVPGPIKETPGAVTVQGTAGASQENRKVWIEPITKDKDGNLARASTKDSMAANLNETVTLPAGSYEILYSHSMMFVDLAPGENKIVELKKISVPKVDGTYQVELFADLTNSTEYAKRLQALWGQGYNRGAWDDGTDEGSNSSVVIGYPRPPELPHDKITAICRAKNGKWKGAGASGCAAWKGASSSSLNPGAVKADKDANLWMVDFNYNVVDVNKENIVTSVQPTNDETKFTNFGRRDLAYGVDGDFFSVLPGVYGLTFKSLAGKVSTQMGIVVN